MGKAVQQLRHLEEQLENAVIPKAKTVKRSLCSVMFLTMAVKTVALCINYWVFSIGLTFYNQRIIKHFKFPLTMTVTHLVIKFMLSGLVRALLQWRSGKPRTTLPWGVFCKRIAPVGIASALDIGLSNWSFEFITVSLYTMSKSSSVIFILIFAIILKLEKLKCSLVLVVLLIATGLFMFTYHSTQFNLEGFIMVMTAAVLSGMRWTFAQVILQKKELGLHNPIDMMYHIQPWMILGILPLAAGFEGLSIATTDQLFRFSDYDVVLRNIGFVLLGACLAFLLEFSEYLFLSHISSLTLSISGIFKEACTLYLAHQINGDKMNLVNGIGLIVCLSGIALHVVLKAIASREEALSQTVRHIEEMEMLAPNGSANISDDEDDNEIFNVKNDR